VNLGNSEMPPLPFIKKMKKKTEKLEDITYIIKAITKTLDKSFLTYRRKKQLEIYIARSFKSCYYQKYNFEESEEEEEEEKKEKENDEKRVPIQIKKTIIGGSKIMKNLEKKNKAQNRQVDQTKQIPKVDF